MIEPMKRWHINSIAHAISGVLLKENESNCLRPLKKATRSHQEKPLFFQYNASYLAFSITLSPLS
jgi:hypothetical protein